MLGANAKTNSAKKPVVGSRLAASSTPRCYEKSLIVRATMRDAFCHSRQELLIHRISGAKADDPGNSAHISEYRW